MEAENGRIYSPKNTLQLVWLQKKKSEFIQKCIATWKKYLPEYEIIEWNEDNFSLEDHPFAKEAYEAGKYAFVSDYVRVYVIYHYGGIYFDTDIEVRCNFSDKLAGARFVIAFERPESLMTGFFAAEKENTVVKEILDYYDRISFYNEDGSMKLTPNPIIFAQETAKFGLVFNGEYQELGNGMKIYPNEIFGGYNVYDMIYTITDRTVVVHHYTASWRTVREEIPVKIKKFLLKLFGVKFFRFMRKVKHLLLGERKK
ncbi:MAG: glycosyltransferase family 32 protein [Eisenbergiella massiliensis]